MARLAGMKSEIRNQCSYISDCRVLLFGFSNKDLQILFKDIVSAIHDLLKIAILLESPSKQAS